MTINWKAMKTRWYATDAWRAAHEPEAIREAITMGEQIVTLLTHAVTLVERAYQDMDSIIEDATIQGEAIVDRLHIQATRLEPVLTRLRAADKAVVNS
jgi:hypothetical protein